MNNMNIHNADCLIKLDELNENSVDSIVTDPPYELNFMNNEWDKAGIAFNPNTWRKAMRVLKPGGYLLAFSHSRRFHRMAVAIEDAGFEIRDTIMWLYGSGFPKSHNISKAIDRKFGAERTVIYKAKGVGSNNTNSMNSGKGSSQEFPNEYNKTIAPTPKVKQWEGWGSALKPAYEPIVMARKPFKGSIADNVLEHGVGGINIDECRVPSKKGEYDVRHYENEDCFQNKVKKKSKFKIKEQPSGRFPANIIHDGSKEVVEKFPNTKSGGSGNEYNRTKEKHDVSAYNHGSKGNHYVSIDSDSASRFFYTAKASKKERNYGVDKNNHPTVKPIKLMQYLIRLITPKNGVVLDPFMGSGSTALALLKENYHRNANYGFIGIEKELDYYEIAEKRITFAKRHIK